MRTMTFRRYALLSLLALGALGPVVAVAQAGGDGVEFIAPLPLTEGRGCYYDRGEEYCGAYCYWEINGKRYCTQRLRHAHSQASPQHEYQAEPRPYRYQPRYEILK